MLGRSYSEVKNIIESIGYKWLDGDKNKRYSGESRVVYTCGRGHIRSVLLKTLLGGSRCKECYRKRQRLTINEVRSRVERFGWDLIAEEYPNRYVDLHFRCNKGHDVYISYNKFVQCGGPCRQCHTERQRIPFSDVLKGFGKRNVKVISREEDYKNNKSPLKCVCENGHEFITCWHSFNICEASCPNCRKYSSKSEIEIGDFVSSFGFKIEANKRGLIKNREIDIYIPSKSLAIEYCGLYWHSQVSGGKDKYYHFQKRKRCEDKNIRLITVFEDEYTDRPAVVKSRIRNALGIPEKRIFARKCIVKEITSREGRDFLYNHHLQGSGKAKYYFGLFYNDELILVMSFGLPARAHTRKSGLIELKRLASKSGVSIVGGASKVFKFVLPLLEKNGFIEIVSYCDMRWASLYPFYEKIGFKKDEDTRVVPTPHYIINNYTKRVRNQGLALKSCERGKGKTEKQLRLEQGYDIIWDCGHRKYIYRLGKEK